MNTHFTPSVLGSAMAMLWGCVALLMPATAPAQTPAAGFTDVPGPGSNFVQVLGAQGDSLWAGPNLTLTTDGGATFRDPEVPALQDNVLFAIDLHTDPTDTRRVTAGLAFDSDGVPAAGGFLVSSDGGDSFEQAPAALDTIGDTLITYGNNTLSARPIVQEAGSAPQDLARSPSGDTLWVASGNAGLRYSTDEAESWTRVVLPPDTLDAITPEATYDFEVAPFDNGQGWLNHVGATVLVDETGTVWAGTAGGVNRSAPNDVAAGGNRAWTRDTHTGTPDALTGDNVVVLAEQPRTTNRSAIWMVTWPINRPGAPAQRFGVTRTLDGGATYEQTLVDERIFDLAFDDNHIYAGGDNGLFISDDDGASWTAVRRFELADERQFHRPDAGVRSVTTTRNAVWAGTTDGLLRSTDNGRTWTLFRTNFPLDPDEPGTDGVETYAYPNPFTPSSDRVVRIRYERAEAGSTRIRLYDFNMRPVRTLRAQGDGPGEQEIAWDGTDDGGLRLPNGTYFYEVETDQDEARGKILLID